MNHSQKKSNPPTREGEIEGGGTVVDLRASFNEARARRMDYTREPLTETEKRLDYQLGKILDVMEEQQVQIDALRKKIFYLLKILQDSAAGKD